MSHSFTARRTLIRSSVVGGGLTAIVLGGLAFTVGLATGNESGRLLEAALATIRFIGSAIVTAAATVLALMLTLLGLSIDVDREIDTEFYQELRKIALLDVVAFAAGCLLLTVLVVPFGDEASLSSTVYTVLYYSLTTATAIAMGLLLSVMFALYGAFRDLIAMLHGDASPLVSADDAQNPSGDGDQPASTSS